ncbi:MAG: MmcQ/YjbR family DNA-binding protein [Gammaproteobacteria bacterium]|nr:MmcQ/YjbR family DNA-binding protein [Gammaproteobacteria bacterium]
MAKEPVPIKFPPDKQLAERFARVVQIAQRYPGVEESRSYGTPAIKVKRKLLARLRSEAEGGLAIVCDLMEREMLMQAAPETFYITDHYADWPMVLINLETVRWDAMPDILERAWRRVASPGLLKQYDTSATPPAKPR